MEGKAVIYVSESVSARVCRECWECCVSARAWRTKADEMGKDDMCGDEEASMGVCLRYVPSVNAVVSHRDLSRGSVDGKRVCLTSLAVATAVEHVAVRKWIAVSVCGSYRHHVGSDGGENGDVGVVGWEADEHGSVVIDVDDVDVHLHESVAARNAVVDSLNVNVVPGRTGGGGGSISA